MSCEHESIDLKKDSAKYWDFSFDELAKYDVEANLEYVSRFSLKDKKVIYIGHSQGTT
jgi:predicted alpha/beta hydrolase